MDSISNCVSLSKLNLEQIIPIFSACKFYIGNDTGPLHISANLNLKCLAIFCDSPPSAYGLWNPNIKIVVPAGDSLFEVTLAFGSWVAPLAGAQPSVLHIYWFSTMGQKQRIFIKKCSILVWEWCSPSTLHERPPNTNLNLQRLPASHMSMLLRLIHSSPPEKLLS